VSDRILDDIGSSMSDDETDNKDQTANLGVVVSFIISHAQYVRARLFTDVLVLEYQRKREGI
jgi:hypothetical protein